MNNLFPLTARSLIRLVAYSCLLAIPSAWADTLYVQSDQAALLEEPRFDAPTLVELPRGESLTLIQEDNNWLKVEHQSVSAWVSRWLVGAAPPKQKTSVLTGAESTGEVRRRASGVTTAGAVRGLSEGEDELGGSAADYTELEFLETLGPTPEALRAFQAPLAENEQ